MTVGELLIKLDDLIKLHGAPKSARAVLVSDDGYVNDIDSVDVFEDGTDLENRIGREDFYLFAQPAPDQKLVLFTSE